MSNPKIKKITAMATDPIYIGTGGFTIGRVDNTIVRDPITNIPKIPGSSIAGTWRYFVALELISSIKDKQPNFDDIKNQEGDELKTIEEKLKKYNWNGSKPTGWKGYYGNQIAKITCAGQDNISDKSIEDPNAKDKDDKTGHCGHCIVCKAFGFSKKDKSSQGMLFFSDLNILFFPVYTRLGVRWITSNRILEKIGLDDDSYKQLKNDEILTYNGNENYLNLGWLNLKVIDKHNFCSDKFFIDYRDVIIVSDELISQIINSNLEVRTSVSIDPLTGAAKEGALFTSEAIPRGTIFSGEVRIFRREGDDTLPEAKLVEDALTDSKQYFGTLGIGGMTTRGFGRLEVEFK